MSKTKHSIWTFYIENYGMVTVDASDVMIIPSINNYPWRRIEHLRGEGESTLEEWINLPYITIYDSLIGLPSNSYELRQSGMKLS